MYCFRTTVTTDKGDALVGWQLECVQNDNLTTPVTIYSDESSTPIVSVSGVSNRAVSDSAGNAYFFVEDGVYGIRYYDSAGVYQRTESFFSMFGTGQVDNDPLLAGNSDILVPSQRATKAYADQVNALVASSFGGANDTAILNAAIAAAVVKGAGATVWLDRDFTVTSITNPYGVDLVGPGNVLTAITGGNQQLNSYADIPGRYVFGEEYLDRVMQRLKLGASGSSGQIGCFLYGDSTVAGGYMSMSTVNLLQRLFHVRGVGNIAFTNRGVAGTTIADLGLLSDLATTTDLAIIKYGINDGTNTEGTRLATFQSTLDSKLTAIRAATNGGRGNLAIVLVGPNATADTPNGRDERWYEQLRGIYVAAARKHKCAYVDVYGYMRDARGGAGVGWDNPYGDGRTIHPTDSVGARMWGLVVDAIIPSGWSQWWGSSLFRNVTNTSNAPSASAAPSQFLTGIDHARATVANGWPIEGFVISNRNPDSGVVQFLYPFAANDTRVLMRTANTGSDTWNRWTGAPETLSLFNSWVSFGGTFGTPSAYIDANKTVRLRGMIKSGTTTAGTKVAALPTGMAPAIDEIFPVSANGGTVHVKVQTNGDVVLQTTGDATFTSLAGIAFLAA